MHKDDVHNELVTQIVFSKPVPEIHDESICLYNILLN